MHDNPTSARVADDAWQTLRIAGPAALSFLQRILSNRVAGLGSDRASAAFILQPTGRILAAGIFFTDDDNVVALCPPGWRDKLQAGLEKYRIADPVQFEPLPAAAWPWLNPPTDLLAPTRFGVVRTPEGVAIRSDFFGDGDILWLGAMPSQLPTLTEADAEQLRIRAGTPAFGRELTEDTIPLEAGLYDWLSNTKGCYVGQEVIERMWSRDRIARRLVWVRGSGNPGDVALPAAIQGADGGKGVLTSLCQTAEGEALGLGYYPTQAPIAAYSGEGRQWTVAPVPVRTA